MRNIDALHRRRHRMAARKEFRAAWRVVAARPAIAHNNSVIT
jgi:hypothetical protein